MASSETDAETDAGPEINHRLPSTPIDTCIPL